MTVNDSRHALFEILGPRRLSTLFVRQQIVDPIDNLFKGRTRVNIHVPAIPNELVQFRWPLFGEVGAASPVDDLFVKGVSAQSTEWPLSGVHFPENNSKRVHVGLAAVALLAQHLRRHVERRAHEREGAPRRVGLQLREAEVDELEVAVLVEQQVLWLEVAVAAGRDRQG